MAADPSPPDGQSLSGDPIVSEAMKRFRQCVEWEASARERFLKDLRFAYGDSENGYQWPNAIRQSRDNNTRPCLTLNIVKQHNLQIVNEAKKNKADVKIVALGNGASQESANIFKAIIRHIKYQSNAQAAYSTAREFQVFAGIGWWRIVTDYSSNDTADEQEIFIRRVPDPLSIYMDPDCQEKDCSDARFAFVFDTIPKDDFDDAYPKYKGLASFQPLGTGTGDNDDWIGKDHVRVCEYFRLVPKRDKIISFLHSATGQRLTIRQSKLHPNMVDEVLDNPQTRFREVEDQEVQWKLIVGETVIDDTVWVGKHIPLIRVVGEEIVIDGIMDRKGHTRSMTDAQRMYNYNASGQVEFVALQSKTPWVAAAKAIEDLEQYWNTANTINHAVLPFNHLDDDGNPIPPPERQQPPTASPAYESGMQTAFNQIMMVSGQFQNEMGMLGNERTGKAIAERQEQSATSVYHYQDNYEDALRYEGKQLLDLIPKVYDTKRVKKILADDGTEMEVEIDPAARQSYFQQLAHDNTVIKRIFNPQIGNYDVAADVGPAWDTKRQETVNALTLILTQAPGLTGLIGDLLLRDMDFDSAQEAAQRLRRMVPPQALGVGPTAKEQQLMQQVQSLQLGLGKALERGAKDNLKLVGKDQMRDIDAYDAETKRMAALQKLMGGDPAGLQEIIQQLVQDALHTSILPILQANSAGLGNEASQQPDPPPASNGLTAAPSEWDLTDPTRRLRVMRIAPLAREITKPGVVG